MQLPFLREAATRLRSLKSHFNLAALTAPVTVAGIVRSGTGLCLTRLHRVKNTLTATHADCIALPPEVGPEEIAAAAVERLATWGGVECAAFGLDYSATILRSFRFPFGGQRQIKAVLPQEFADSSLLPPEQYCLAQAAPVQDPDEKFTVTAAAANRADAAVLARAFSSRGIALRSLTPLWSVLPFVWRNSGGDSQAICFVDLDHTREAYSLLDDGTVRATLCLPPGDGGIEQLAGRIAFFMEQTGEAERIVMAGHGSVDGGLTRQLEDKLGLPVEKLGAPRNIDMSAIGAMPERFALAAALAVSLLAPRPAEEINFLTGELAPAADIPEWQNTACKVCAAACLVVASLCALEAAQGIRERGAIRPLQQELFRSYREALPDVMPTTSIAQMQRIMETRLREWRMGAQAEAGGERGTALDILTAMHQALAPDMQGVAEAMTLSRDRFTLSGTVPDFRMAETIREKLVAHALFEDVRIRNVQRGEQQRVRYEIEGKIRQP